MTDKLDIEGIRERHERDLSLRIIGPKATGMDYVHRQTQLDRGNLLIEVTRLRSEEEEQLLQKGRYQARLAVLTMALAYQARNGQAEWAKKMIKMADEAAVKVKIGDMVTMQLNRSKPND